MGFPFKKTAIYVRGLASPPSRAVGLLVCLHRLLQLLVRQGGAFRTAGEWLPRKPDERVRKWFSRTPLLCPASEVERSSSHADG